MTITCIAFLVVAYICIGCVFSGGLCGAFELDGSSDEDIWGALMLVVMWPFVPIAGILWLLFRVGKYLGRKIHDKLTRKD